MLQNQSTNVTTFNSAQFGDLRTHQTENGNVWFCLNDIAKALELSNPRDLVKRLNSKGVDTIDTPTLGGNQLMTYIDEPNLYRCIFQSRKSEAEQFQGWVFEEVLPSIRKTGGYLSTTHEDTPELIMAKALRLAQATIEKRQRELEQVKECVALQAEQLKQSAPKAEAFEKYIDSTCYISANQIAKEYGWGAVTLNKHLHELGIQYKQCDQWLLYSQYDNNGYTVSRPYTFVNKEGEVINRMSTYWTAKGREFIHSVLYKRLNVVPLGQQHDYNN